MIYTCLTLGLALAVLAVCATAGEAETGTADDNDARAQRFIAEHEKSVKPLEIEVARLWWEASIHGGDEAYRKKQEAETRLERRLSDTARFAELEATAQKPIRDPLMVRQLALLRLQYLPRQVEPELLEKMLAISNAIEQQFNAFRAKVGDRQLSENEVRRLLRTSHDSAERRAAWEAGKEVGRLVNPGLMQLVKLRNEAARKLHFPNYYAMQLALGEQSPAEVLRLFDDLDRMTRGPFHAVKAEIDAALARDCGIAVAELRPWHYHDPFFQEAPEIFGARHDDLYAKLDIPKLCRDFYAGIGLPIDDVLGCSDLYERKGKNPHAFCNDLDRQGDVRVLANIVADRQWLGTMLHELGHATYSSKNIPARLPYVLRAEAHTLSTEAVAMMFEKFADDTFWLQAMGVTVPEPEQFRQATLRLRRAKLLVFSRWCQVMFRFEQALYENPEQDLSRLWWDLVERYQELKRPEGRNAPDYAAKIHIVMSPVYYHNYMLGELFAAQLHHAIARDVLHGVAPRRAVYVGNPAVGRFMIDRVFAPGRTLDWSGLARHATGEDLSPKAFAEDIGEKP